MALYPHRIAHIPQMKHNIECTLSVLISKAKRVPPTSLAQSLLLFYLLKKLLHSHWKTSEGISSTNLYRSGKIERITDFFALCKIII